jgi:hypothetical protein
MAIRDRTYLKGKFENGDYPVQDDYHDWLDSFIHVNDTIAESVKTITVTDANRTDPVVLAAGEYTIFVTLDAALTGDWVPSDFSGFEQYKDYRIFIEKNSDNGVDFSALPRVYFDDDIDPFVDLINLRLGQMAAMYAVGLKTGLLLSRLIIPNEKYFPPVFSSVFSSVFNK